MTRKQISYRSGYKYQLAKKYTQQIDIKPRMVIVTPFIELTKAGEVETDEIKVAMKGETWASLIRDEKLGYLALLRNLRNIAKQAPEALDAALNQIVDSDRIKESKVLPFRFDTALEAVSGLERAVSISSA